MSPTRGWDNETLLANYKKIGRTVANYAAPVWSPSMSRTHWNKLQSCQNAALSIAIGLRMSLSYGKNSSFWLFIKYVTRTTTLRNLILARDMSKKIFGAMRDVERWKAGIII